MKNESEETEFIIMMKDKELGVGYYTGRYKVREQIAIGFSSSVDDREVKRYKTRNRAELEKSKIEEFTKYKLKIMEVKNNG